MQVEILKDELVKAIQKAFSDVKHPGDGIFGHESGYYDVKPFLKWKKWEEIPEKVINYLDDVTTYVSPEGFHFLIPAFLIFALNHPLTNHANYAITSFTVTEESQNWYLRRINIFNEQQREVIILFLNFLIQEQTIYSPYYPEKAIHSLKKYWGHEL